MRRLITVFVLITMLLAGCSYENVEADDTDTRPDSTPSAAATEKQQTNITPLDEGHVYQTAQPDSTPVPSLPPWPDGLLSSVPYQAGDQGEEVAFLQQMLLELGFDPGEPDGVFGSQMKKATDNFQLYAGMDVDGVAGSQTVNALLERHQAASAVYQQANQPLKGFIIGLDPGHQRNDNAGLEPISPNSEKLKKMVSAGTYGRFSGVPEYVITLQVGLKLRASLEAQGAQVIMTRDKHGVDITNAERAKMMNKAGVDCWLRIHANGTDDPKTAGMFILVPAENTMNTNESAVQKDSVVLAEVLLMHTLKATGAKDLGIIPRSDQTGFGWSQVPVCNIEMGHMTNKQEDYMLVSEDYQESLVEGLTQGFIDYFGNHKKGWDQ